MTWRELIEAAKAIPEAELHRAVFFKEPYDHDARLYEVTLTQACEDIYDGDNADRDGDSAPRVRNDDYFLVV